MSWGHPNRVFVSRSEIPLTGKFERFWSILEAFWCILALKFVLGGGFKNVKTLAPRLLSLTIVRPVAHERAMLPRAPRTSTRRRHSQRRRARRKGGRRDRPGAVLTARMAGSVRHRARRKGGRKDRRETVLRAKRWSVLQRGSRIERRGRRQ